MNEKTKTEIAYELDNLHWDAISKEEALARIIAIIDKERTGEVVMCNSMVNFVGWTDADGPTSGGKYIGKRGRLVFVPEQEKGKK